MKKRRLFAFGIVILAILVALIVVQTSFSFRDFGPSSTPETYIFWGVFTLVFLLTITLGFMLFRTALKLYVERERGKEGSRIRTRLVIGALSLSFLPVIFLVLFSLSVLSNNLTYWFTRPAQNIKFTLIDFGVAMDQEAQARAALVARMLDHSPRDAKKICEEQNVEQAWLETPKGQRNPICPLTQTANPRSMEGRITRPDDSQIVVRLNVPLDYAAKQREIAKQVAEYDDLYKARRYFRDLYILLLTLITIFILFVATWIAQFMARQISDPISTILEAADEVRRGNLSHRIKATALDELGTLIRAFNQMTHDLEANSRELERRRRFTEAILESIPTGVISIANDGKILRYNQALLKIFPTFRPEPHPTIDQLFPPEEVKEIRYIMKRARRTGVASRQLDFRLDRQSVHIAVTVAALEEKVNSGFVIVVEDTGELLRAQKAAAWHEVARRIAHEIKNPLTPIALCAERVVRQLDRLGIPPESSRVLRDCCQTILSEVESVKTLVDEFSQFARFPAAQLTLSDLNESVENALGVFDGRLDGIEVRKQLAAGLPPVELDREQFKRAVVNLIDNAAEAMQDSHIKRLTVMTQAVSPEMIELTVADTGCGVSTEDKEKLFLPYFSTKGRGTGLGLAIVNQVVSDHRAQIRIEDNQPTGTRFIVEIPVAVSAEVELKPVEAQA